MFNTTLKHKRSLGHLLRAHFPHLCAIFLAIKDNVASFQRIVSSQDLFLQPPENGEQERDALCDVDVKLGGAK